MSIRVLLVEDHDIVRQGLKALLAPEPEIELIGETGDTPEIFSKINECRPDIVLMDLGTPVATGLEHARRIKQEYPQVKVLILCLPDYESYLVDLLSAGADGYVLKNSSRGELVFAIKKIINGGIYTGTEFTLGLLAKYKALSGNNHQKRETSITEREMDVLNLIAQGRTNTEIARQLFTSVRTIETRRKNLLEKTGTSNTATLMRFALLNGLIQ